MFGQAAGAEAKLTKLNQYVVTRVDGGETIYWVLHKRAEDPVSVLIMTLNKDVEAKRIKADDVFNIISSIVGYKTFHTQPEFNQVASCHVTKWEHKEKTFVQTIEHLVGECKESCAFGWEKKGE